MKRSAITRVIPVTTAIYAVLGGAISLTGWLLPSPRLIDWIGTGIEIKANTAVAVLIAGLALAVYLIRPDWKLLTCLLGAVVAAIGAATLFEHISGRDLGIDTLLFSEPPGASATSAPGRMGLPASSSLTLLGIGLSLLGFDRRARLWASALGSIALGIASLSLVGYFFGANQLYSIAKYTGIAFQTATMIAALGIGVAWAVPEHGFVAALGRDDTGGLVFRRLILPAIVCSLILGWLRVAGQREGLYDTEFGTAARTIAEILLLLGLLWRTTNAISRAEAETRLLSLIPAENPNPVMRLSRDGECLYANEASLRSGIDWTSDGGDPVAERLRKFSRQALSGNKRVTEEIGIGDRLYSCTFAPFVDSNYVNVYADDITTRKQSEAALSRRVEEMAALYRFTDALNRSTDLDNVYTAALDAITDALGYDRSSILLFDDEAVMSFVAWRGLSDEYRRKLNGHSPWKEGALDAQPFGIADISLSDQPDDVKEIIAREGITSLAFIPLISNRRLIGKFMVYHSRPHDFTESELALALTIAYQIAFGVERQKIEQLQRQSEAALRENDTRLRLATRTGKVGVWDWDMLTNRVSWTESLYVMHGIDKSGFDGTIEGFTALIHKHDRDAVADAMERALNGTERYEVEFRVVRPDGKLVWLYTNATLLRDGDVPLRMIGATIDITERKLAELEKGKLATIVESSIDAIISKDPNGYIISWNKAAEQLFGYTAEEAVGRSITIIIPSDRLDEEASILSRIRRNEKVQHYETVRRRKDGSLVDISLSISPISDANGNVIAASKIVRDITQRKAAEVAMRESEIMRTLVDAQEAERHRIARDLHDHLGQQLTALRLKLESLRAKAVDSEDLLHEIDETRKQASRIDMDINFLSWELRPTELDNLGLNDALSSFVREWSANYGISAEFHGAYTKNGRLNPEIETNLYRIAQEGLNNVLKHAQATKVSVLLERRGDNALLIIEDDGIGFEPDLTARRGKNGKGSGLGLIGMRERTALLGGSLEIETFPGKGTSLFALVPLGGAETKGDRARA